MSVTRKNSKDCLLAKIYPFHNPK